MQDLNLNYNYVIVGCDGYYLVGYHDVINLPCVSYHKDYREGFSSFVPRQLLRWNFSRELNKYIHTPFSHYVYPRLFPHHFPEKKPLCYIFFGANYHVFQTSYLDYLRKRHTDTKLVLYMQDLVSKNKYLNFGRVADKFDLLLSYDKGDSLHYGMEYHPTPMSYVDIPDNREIKQSDIYFCGYAKTRYHIIHQLYNKLTELGYVCDFNILGMPKDASRISGIKYLCNPIDYKENLQHIKKTRCILEVMQEGADGFTPRLWESIIYDRHLLTNNGSIRQTSYYDARGCHELSMSHLNEISEWIDKPLVYDKSLKDSLSPCHLLKFIDKKLSR